MQTLAAAFWGRRGARRPSTVQTWVELPDGDRLALHDDHPLGWTPANPCVLLVHGLAGCHRSRYMVRIGSKLQACGARVFRIDLRGCGAGRNQSRHPYHAGRWEDIEAAARAIAGLTGGAPLSVAGFSLGGSLVLRWLGEPRSSRNGSVHRAISVNPPVDLMAATSSINRAAGGLYDRYFARTLYRHVRSSAQWNPDSPLARRGQPPVTLREFDDLFTAPLCGFGTAENYYRTASAAQVVPCIETPTLILSAADDPLIPVETLRALQRPRSVQLHLESRGGHLGYLAGTTTDPDRHWMDWRVLDWLLSPSDELSPVSSLR